MKCFTYHIFSHNFTSGSGGGNPLKTSKTGRVCDAAWVRSVRRSTEQYQRLETQWAESQASGERRSGRTPPHSTVTSSSRHQFKESRRTPPSTTPSSSTSSRRRSSRQNTRRDESVSGKIPLITHSSKERCTLSFSLLIMHASCTLIPTFAPLYLKAEHIK